MTPAAIAAVSDQLSAAVGRHNVRAGQALSPYLQDATFLAATPDLAVLPGSTEEVASVVGICAAAGVLIVARGAGTGLAGGPVALGGGVVLSLERMTKLEVDPANCCATAGAGVVVGAIQAAATEHGLFYPPDPGSVMSSTIGGNLACNAGGMCCLKYGVSADHVIGMTVVLADGTVLKLGGKTRKRASGYRLMQLFVGSEGTLGIITEAVLKLLPLPRHRATAMVGFSSLDAAAEAVARLMGSGHLPSALELIDRTTLELVWEALPTPFQTGLEAVLLVEQDGAEEGHVQAQLEVMVEVLAGVTVTIARGADERSALWEARRMVGRVLMQHPRTYLAEDIAVPIAAVPEMTRRIRRVAEQAGLKVMVFGHAGDGNLHPTFLFQEEDRGRVGPAAARVLHDAVELGGSVSAEHGLGALKRDFAEAEHGAAALALMWRLKQLLDPGGILNPQKIFPQGPADGAFLDRQPGWNRGEVEEPPRP